MLERLTGTNVTFFQWMVIGVPVMLVMFAFVAVQFHFAGARGVTIGADSTQMVRDELHALGPVTRGQRNVLAAFAITVALWVTPGVLALAGLDEIAVRARPTRRRCPRAWRRWSGACLLFVLPVDWRARRFTITWDEALKIDWGIVFLYGGGLAMGDAGVRDRAGRGDGAGHHVAAAVAVHRRRSRCCSRPRRSCCRKPRRTPRRPT